MGFRPDAAILQEKSVTFLHSFSDQIHNELVLLAPAGCFIPESFRRRYVDCNRHARWLSDAQRLRGGIYLADGAVQPSQLSADGRHVQHADYDSWHVLTVDGKGAVQGCARYRHLIGNVGFDDLGPQQIKNIARPGSAGVQNEIAMNIGDIGGVAGAFLWIYSGHDPRFESGPEREKREGSSAEEGGRRNSMTHLLFPANSSAFPCCHILFCTI